MSKTAKFDLFDDSQMIAAQEQAVKAAEVKWEQKMYKPAIPTGQKTHTVKVRFIPNIGLNENGKLQVGPNIVSRYHIYINVQEFGIQGYWDCDRGCQLTDMFFKMKKSDNAVIKDAAQLINRSTKYLSYVQIIEDSANPELVGSIMPFQYGVKIKDKIDAEGATAFSISNAANFDLKMTMVGGFVNYDTSAFDYKSGSGPLKINGKAVSKENQDEVLAYITSCEHKIEDFRTWDKGKITVEEYERVLVWAKSKLTGVGQSYSPKMKDVSATELLENDEDTFFDEL